MPFSPFLSMNSPLWMGEKKGKYTLLLRWCSPKGGLAGEDPNNRVAKEHILWIPVSPFHCYCRHHPVSLRTKRHGGRLCVCSATGTSNYQSWPDYAYCRVLICQQGRRTLIPWHGTIVWIISQLSGGRLTKLDHCYNEKEAFCSYWNRHLHCICICLFACDASAKTTICGLYRIPYSLSWYSTKRYFWWRKFLHTKISVAMGPCSWDWLIPHHPGLTEWWNAVF